MWTASPRRLLLIAALLDLVGQLLLFLILVYFPIHTGLSIVELSVEGQWGWLTGSVFLYLVFRELVVISGV